MYKNKEARRNKWWKALLLLCGLLIGGIGLKNTVSADANLDVANFPDASFRSYLSKQYDDNKDDILSTIELQGITKLNLSKKNIKDLTGVELLTSLQVLECDDNYISDLDLSKNRELAYLDCSGNRLVALDVSKNAKLKTLIAYSNGMRELNIGLMVGLETLDCSNNRLHTLSLAGLESLTKLNCSGNQLPSIDVSENKNLEELVCSKNYILSLNLSNNVNLKKLTCNRNGLTQLTLPATNTLTSITCNDNNLNTLDVKANTGLRSLNCSNNQIANLQLDQANRLEQLYCANNKISQLDVSANGMLLTLDCSNNKLGYLDVEANGDLATLRAYGNERTVFVKEDGSVDVSLFVGFDIGKAKNWVNATIEGDEGNETIQTQPNKKLAFTYEMGTGQEETFQWNSVGSKQVVFNSQDITMTVSDELTLLAELLGGTDTESIQWTSSNTSVVQVETDGTLKALSTGEATITASAEGYASAACKVTVMEQIKTLVVSNIPVHTLDGGEAKPDLTVTCNNKVLTNGVDYDVTFINNNDVGLASAIITGKGYYVFEVVKEFRICYDVNKMIADAIADQAFTGSGLTPQVILRNNGIILKQGVDYTLQYSSNQNPGTAIITIKGTGDYTGEKLMTFNIKIPQVQNLKKKGNVSGSITLTWKKLDYVDGYRVYRYDSSAKKYVRLTTLKGNDVVTYTDKNCVSGTAYRYRVRALVNINGTNQFGAYTTVLKTASKLEKPTLKVTAGKAGTRKASLKWNKIKGSNGYRIYMKEGKTGKYALVKTVVKGGKITFTKTSLTRGKVYYFRIRAYKTVSGATILGTYSKGKKVTAK